MVELRQRVLQKNRSPPPDGLRNGDSAGAVPRRSSRRAGPELDDRQSEHRLKATYKNGIITIHGLAQRESNLDDGPGTDNESQDNNNMTWEDRWLESPSKRRKVDRTGSSQANSPVKESGKAPPSPTDLVSTRPSQNTPTAPSAGKSDDELPRPRRGRFGRPEFLLGRSRTTSSRYLNPATNAGKSLRGSSFGSGGDHSEAPEQAQLVKDSFDGVDNFSSARSTPIHAMSPAQSESPSPGPPEQDEEVPSGEPAEAKEPNQLDDHDFPPPFLPFPALPSPDQFPDEAAYLLSKLFPPMSQPNRFIRALTSHSPNERSTETLFALAQNTQKALKAWQDEYLRLDKRTAPVSIPIPKKPATGGRVPADPAAFESEKHKELYGEGSVLAAAMGIVHGPVGGKASNNISNNNNHAPAGNVGAHRGTGRELRKRKGDPSVLDGLGISSDDAGGRGVSKRTRRPARRFEIGQNAQEAPEPEPAPAKPVPGRRRRRGGAQGLSQRPAEKEQNGRVKRGRIGTLLRDDSAPGSSAATPEVEDDKDRVGSRKSTATDVAQSIEHKPARSQAPTARAGQAATARTSTASNATNNAAAPPTVAGKVPIQANTTETTGPSGRRQKAKSEKRSESMTLWWAQRKKKAAEEKMRQMRERGELYGPTEGIMDTSEPINIGINKKRNAAAMNSQANATSAPSAAANKNFHARPMAMSIPHSYAPHQGQPLPPMHHQQQPPPPGSSFMWPNPPTPGGQQRNQHWPQPQPFHLPPGQQASQDSSPHSGRMQPFSHFPPPPPDHVVRGMGHPGHNYPPPSYPPSNPPGPPMPPHHGQHQNPYSHPPYDHRSSHPSGHHPAHSPAHHHAPPPLLPPPTPSQQHPHHPPPDQGPNPPPLPGREGDSRGPPPPPLPPPRDDPGRPPSQGNQPPQSHYHHASHPGYGPIARSPPGQGYNPPPPPPHPNQQQQQQQQPPKQQPHNYMHVQQLPLAATPGPPPHHQHPPPPPQGGPGSSPMHGPPPSQQPGQSPKQDQQANPPPPSQQPSMQHSRQQSHYYPMPWGARFSRY